MVAEPSQADQTEMFKVIKKQAPNAIYYCLQGQITTFIVSLLGSSPNIANLGALTRFAIIFTIVQTAFQNLYVPHFAKCQSRKGLTLLYFKILGGFLVIASVPFLLLVLFPKAFLGILGAQYNHLGHDLVFAGLASVLSAAAGLLSMLNQARAWVLPSTAYIGISILSVVIVAPIVDWNTIRGVLLFQIAIVIPLLPLQVYRTMKGLKTVSLE